MATSHMPNANQISGFVEGLKGLVLVVNTARHEATLMTMDGEAFLKSGYGAALDDMPSSLVADDALLKKV